MWWHRVGQRVACRTLLDGCRGDWDEMAPLVVGETYTIRDVLHWRGSVGVRLAEVANPVVRTWPDAVMRERYYMIQHFAPVRDTSIDQFEALLNPTPEARRHYLDELAREALEDVRAMSRDGVHLQSRTTDVIRRIYGHG